MLKFLSMIKIFKYILLFVFLFSTIFQATFAEGEEEINIFVFSRDDCGHCKAEIEFLETLESTINIKEIKLEDSLGRENFDKITKKYDLPMVTPITLVGESVVIGFDGGKEILGKIKIAEENKNYNLDLNYYLGTDVKVENKESVSFLGMDIDIKNLSLFSLSAILGFIDGFNPCAMWVLLTFLIILSQIKDRKKMFYLAGTFIVAESIMYFVILNVWSSAWNFIGYQQIVTFIIGVVAIVLGGYFIYKYYKNKDNFTCDVTSTEYQSKITTKIQNVVKKPLTILSILSILFLAFSVNVIEFACSAGIPQTYTKILDINNLSVLTEQFYMAVYTFMYTMDDFIVFGLALYGYKKFYQFGAKYSKLSTLFAGILIFILGIFLVFFPNVLVF